MRDQLIQYVNLLFAGAPDCDDIRQEILQNTLDHYDDLIAQGVVPESAYRQAISGIGDIGEIIGSKSAASHPQIYCPADGQKQKRPQLYTAVAVALYIICILPVIILQDEVGLCLMLILIAVATGILIASPAKQQEKYKGSEAHYAEQRLGKSVSSLFRLLTLCLYFVISFATHAWHITWLVFPIMAAVKGLIVASMDLKDGVK